MKKFSPALHLPVIMVSCQKAVDTQASNELPEQALKNVSYGADTAQRMDVYLPAGRSTDCTNVMVLVHGAPGPQATKQTSTTISPKSNTCLSSIVTLPIAIPKPLNNKTTKRLNV